MASAVKSVKDSAQSPAWSRMRVRGPPRPTRRSDGAPPRRRPAAAGALRLACTRLRARRRARPAVGPPAGIASCREPSRRADAWSEPRELPPQQRTTSPPRLRPMRPFRFAVQVSNAPSGAAWRDLARRIEGLGYSTLFIPDHFEDQFAPLVALTAAAEATTTCGSERSSSATTIVTRWSWPRRSPRSICCPRDVSSSAWGPGGRRRLRPVGDRVRRAPGADCAEAESRDSEGDLVHREVHLLG